MTTTLLDLPPEILFEIFSYLLVLTPNPNSKHNPRNYTGRHSRTFTPHFTLKPPSFYLRKYSSTDPDELTIINRRYTHPLVSLTCTSKSLSTVVTAFAQHILNTAAYGTPHFTKTEVKQDDNKRPIYCLLKAIWTQCTYCSKPAPSGARDPILPLYNRHFRLCQKCDKERFPKITFTECMKTWKVSREELDDRRNGIASGYTYVAGALARLVFVTDIERYVERRKRMRLAIGWKPRGKMNIKMNVWEWEREERRKRLGLEEEEEEGQEEYEGEEVPEEIQDWLKDTG